MSAIVWMGIACLGLIAPPALAQGGAVFDDCGGASWCPRMVALPAGSFTMGSPEGEAERAPDEGPQRPVTVPRFAIGKFEITRGQWQAFVDATGRPDPQPDGNRWFCVWRAPVTPYFPPFAQDANHPATCLSFADAQDYAAWLSQKTGKRYRLPTEAEWEYAARGGTTLRFGTRDLITPDDAAYHTRVSYQGSPTRSPHPRGTVRVGQYPANGFGLHDMLGNVWEWTLDCRGSYAAAPADGSAATGGDCGFRAARGAAWDAMPVTLRVTHRDWAPPTVRGTSGMRLVRELP
jgi:formylglycine-generating enzyme required for sulfatase activity